MRFYIAARCQEPAREIRELLLNAGHKVGARWLEEHNFGYGSKTYDEYRQRAIFDVEDVGKADELVLLTEPGVYSHGGRHCETGMAIAQHKRVNVIGGFENVFHALPQVHMFDTAEEFIQDLIKRSKAQIKKSRKGKK